jgi:hypothetical protein
MVNAMAEKHWLQQAAKLLQTSCKTAANKLQKCCKQAAKTAANKLQKLLQTSCKNAANTGCKVLHKVCKRLLNTSCKAARLHNCNCKNLQADRLQLLTQLTLNNVGKIPLLGIEPGSASLEQKSAPRSRSGRRRTVASRVRGGQSGSAEGCRGNEESLAISNRPQST